MNLTEKILELKRQKNAIILAHYYQCAEVQDIADYVGDSYYLSKIAKDCKEDTVVFCGVKFMAESAKILSPHKTILLPVIDAGCPMAEMAEAEEVEQMKAEHPNAAVVTYINSTAEVKAVSDVCVTSSNAMDIIKKIEADEIIFLPDKNLGEFIAEMVPDKKFILWKGFCITHRKVKPEIVEKTKELVPGIKVLVHPECEKEVRDMADFLGSTGEIIAYATKNPYKDYLIVTEEGVLHELKKKNPDKNFYVPGSSMNCVNMKKTRLEDVYNCLLNSKYNINIDEDIRVKAYDALMKMHEMGR
jgi:quinolinate synthase